jgi:hypothetical protein
MQRGEDENGAKVRSTLLAAAATLTTNILSFSFRAFPYFRERVFFFLPRLFEKAQDRLDVVGEEMENTATGSAKKLGTAAALYMGSRLAFGSLTPQKAAGG